MKHLKQIILLSLLILVLSACSKTTSLEDIIHGDLYYEGSLVTQFSDQEALEPYYTYLIVNQSPSSLDKVDLTYDLEIRTYDTLLTYKLLFDLSNQEAIAVSQEGSFHIPFKWVNAYLTSMPIPEAFDYRNPPKLALEIDGYEMSYGYSEDWTIHVTDEVDYLIEDQVTSSLNYKTQSQDIAIEGAFPMNPPDQVTLDIIGIGGSTHYDQVDLTALPSPSEEGAYRYELTAEWTQIDQGFSGRIVYHFGISLSLPSSYELNGSTYEPGDAMAILIRNPKSLDYRVEIPTYDKTIGLFYYDDDLVGLIPLDSRTTPGDYDLNIYVDSTNQLLETIAYTVIPKEFETQQLTVSSSTQSLKSDDNYAKDAAKFGDAKSYSVGEKLWEGSFLQPVEGRISTEYSVIRYVNGGAESSRHSGIDIATTLGTPIQAANNGIVTFASDLIVSGNVIVLDHGYGLFTSYVHLDEIYVEDGQTVAKGDIIGAVGTTGYSTGPHLHWSVWKNGVYLNPWKFIDQDPLAVFDN